MDNAKVSIRRIGDKKWLEIQKIFRNKKLFEDFIENNPYFADLKNVYIWEIEWPEWTKNIDQKTESRLIQ
ncbi:MAG: hypothetical protein ACD_2C00073G0010 [uncultured bacterium (gcode 4)]|uniref:Uncharacterized protein n=1 Tax=uncultured bacterium (gcode 4) TaxID=1234023 RepID=K2G6G6_9BACT|nr:MAG: hypothetical protein ACD_2C00073G0010 [uncultured bacterium (gcode 4)]